jgi:hypothetical protein
LAPWAKFENGQDQSAFFNSVFEKTYGPAKIAEIISKRQQK